MSRRPSSPSTALTPWARHAHFRRELPPGGWSRSRLQVSSRQGMTASDRVDVFRHAVAATLGASCDGHERAVGTNVVCRICSSWS